MDEIRVENSQNVIAGSTVSANGDVLVGGQKITNYFYSAQYQDLINQQNKLDDRFSKNRQKREKYPDDEDFKTEQLQIDEERDELQKKLDDLKHEVIRLAETFVKIPLNTERLKIARQYFETGDYAAARTILDAGQMGDELDALLGKKEQLQQQRAENEANLIDKANEFLILARLTAVDFTLADRYDKTIEYFEQSLKAAHTVDNTFAYAYFLQGHNQFTAALRFYTEALAIRRRLAEANPQTYLPGVATTLNNLALLQKDRNELLVAEAGYQEAVAIRRRLAEVNPQTYLPDVAMTLNNLAILHKDGNKYSAAEAGYHEALAIFRHLAEANPQTYLPYVAMTLNNLANLQRVRNQFPAAESGYQEALAIYRPLAEANPQTYLPYVASTLNNLAVLQKDESKFPTGDAGYQEALAIYRRLAEANPQTYLSDVARTLNNLAILQGGKNELPAAEAGCMEALAIYRDLAEANPQTYLSYVARTLNNLANLQKVGNEFPVAKAGYQKALAIYRDLAEANPQTYLLDVAMTLNNLANLQTDRNELPAAEAGFQEALAIRRRLAEANPQTYLPDVASTAVNMSIFYLQNVPDREKSLAYAKEALVAALPFAKLVPAVQNYANAALQVAEAWGLDRKAFIEEAVKV